MQQLNDSRRTRRLLVAAWTVLVVSVAPASRAEEGMWLPDQVPALGERLQSMGLEVPPEAFRDFEKGPVAATLEMMGGTTSFISPTGLILTNHHVAYDAIRENSTPEHDYLANGFLAATREEELSVPSYRATRVMSMTDVTTEVLAAIPEGADDKTRHDAIEKISKKLVAECEKDSGFRCTTATMSGGLQYYLIAGLEFRDIRIVYAPPSAVGNFGGDIDNFVWPRHTGDFSIMRVYVGPDGKPADYSTDNVPYQPPVYLEQASTTLEEGDLTLTMGFPGRTRRYQTSAQIAFFREVYYPAVIAYVSDWLNVIDTASETNREREIRLASTREGLANALKNFQGKLIGLDAVRLIEKRREDDAALSAWIQADPARKAKYGTVLEEIAQLTQQAREDFPLELALRRMQRSSTMLSTAMGLVRLAGELQKPDMERDPGFMERNLPRWRKRLELMQPDLDPEVDRILLDHAIRAALVLPEGKRIDAVDTHFAAGSASAREKRIQKTLDKWYRQTRLTDLEYRLALFDGGTEAIEASDDPFLQFARELLPLAESRKEIAAQRDGAASRLMPLLLEARQAFEPGLMYPDANSTLRISYGEVRGYWQRDAVWLSPFTTLAGVLEKEAGQEPFASPESLLEAIPGYEELRINMVTTNDTTGGNSGSPLINSRGELVGLLFDGNYEGTCDDFVFWDEKGRSISVDLRYIIWFLEEVAHADALLEELNWSSSRFRAEAP